MKLIPLTRGLSAKVDDEDYERIMQWKWYAQVSRRGIVYAARRESREIAPFGHRQLFYMHNQILNRDADRLIVPDHLDGDGLNNQKYNLELKTFARNLCNHWKLRP